tara:strand:+ start:1009 stop:1176 length:168 start_codon:yes stop_codon:yes gene_type:complete
MKKGDTVRHKKTKAIGKVLLCGKNKRCVIVDYSDKTGVMCRWSKVDDLEIIDEAG